jgi:cytochrome c oxidase subunit 2
MWSNVPLFPEQASSFAWRVDLLYTFLVGISIFFSGLIFFLLVFFAVRYRRRSEDEQPRPILGSFRLEVLWTAIPLVLVMVIFAWGARLYFTTALPPDDAMEIYVVGLQWMWKVQHQEGQREINELHVPVGRPVKLIMTSQDVIHSFYVPAFRMKMDVVPGLYTTTWFEASKTGSFHLFCAEYCGTAHAGMVGRIVVMKPTDFENWLSGGRSAEPLARAGERLFQQLGCSGCHRVHGTVRAPLLEGLYGKAVALQGGDTVIADESYIRASILTPQRQIVAGYEPVMPSYQGQISEEGLLQLIAYIKSLAGEGQPGQRTER